MIRIDEIYDNTFWPYIKKNMPSTCMFHHDPFGRSDPDSILCTPRSQYEQNYIYLFDQEPLNFERQIPTWDSMRRRTNFGKRDGPFSEQQGIIVTSELDSSDVDKVSEYLNAKSFYYFFHGWAALDWYRGYDRTYLIQNPEERLIGRTFISPNRIIGGDRLHRVAMLYYFEKYGLFHNHISAPKICPVENVDIVDISRRLKGQYPDIVDTFFFSKNFPKTFQGEETQEMHSCWLSLFTQTFNSLLYHVTETVFFGKKLHLTEKTFKPIAMGMPFVITGTAGSLKYLRSYGFKTFGHIWDESYDEEQDDFKRLDKIANLLKELDSKPRDEKQEIFKECVPVIKHNWEHFYHGSFEAILWKELTSMLGDIRDYFSDR